MDIIISIAVTLFLFGILIFIHELGHYIAARKFKVGILDFAIGMGPKLFAWRGKHNQFSLRALPFGGYVSMLGEYSDYDENELSEHDRGKTPLVDIAAWKRIIICLAGPVMNLLLAFIIMFFIVLLTKTSSLTIAEFTENAASQNWLQQEDTILEIDGTKMRVINDVTNKLIYDGTEPLDILVLRNGEKVLLENVVFEIGVEEGINYGMRDFYVYSAGKSVGDLLYQTYWQTISTFSSTIDGLVNIITGKYGVEALSGPVGVGKAIGGVITESESFTQTFHSLAFMLVMLSVSLGIFNLLPLPVIDGGRILFYIIEMIRKKPMNKKVEEAISAVFMVLLLITVVLIAFKDTIGLFK